MLAACAAASLACAPALAADKDAKPDADKAAADKAGGDKTAPTGIFQPESAESTGVVNVEGVPIGYRGRRRHPGGPSGKGFDDAVAKGRRRRAG